MNEDKLINCWDIIDEEVKELLQKFKNLMSDENNVENATDYLFTSLLDESILGVAFEVHHAQKTGLSAAIKGVPEDDKDFIMLDVSDNDIFGIGHNNKLGKCTSTCPNCNRQVAAARFAPHLEKCMKMGRNSSRIASRRIASTRANTNYMEIGLSDDEDDADWSNGKRRKKARPVRTAPGAASSTAGSTATTRKNGKASGK